MVCKAPGRYAGLNTYAVGKQDRPKAWGKGQGSFQEHQITWSSGKGHVQTDLALHTA